MHEAAGVGKLVNDALLSLINEACMNVCCTTILSSKVIGPACVQTRSSNPRGRACTPSGKGSGEEGILSDIVPVYLYCPAFSVSVSLDVSNPGMHAGRPPQPLSKLRTIGLGGTLAMRADRAYRQPTNMQPGTCYR